MGVSTRKVTEITEQLCGTEISASRLKNLQVLWRRNRSSDGTRAVSATALWAAIQLCTWMPTTRRSVDQGSIQDVAVLKATGVNCWGKREVIGVSCRLSEAEVHLTRVSAAASKALSGAVRR